MCGNKRHEKKTNQTKKPTLAWRAISLFALVMLRFVFFTLSNNAFLSNASFSECASHRLRSRSNCARSIDNCRVCFSVSRFLRLMSRRSWTISPLTRIRCSTSQITCPSSFSINCNPSLFVWLRSYSTRANAAFAFSVARECSLARMWCWKIVRWINNHGVCHVWFLSCSNFWNSVGLCCLLSVFFSFLTEWDTVNNVSVNCPVIDGHSIHRIILLSSKRKKRTDDNRIQRKKHFSYTLHKS